MDQPSPKDPSASPQPSASTPPAPEKPKENIKETIESILIAFILAFVFRAFVVEAFVIPSGSMAPTLMGAHMHYRCQECGYEFTVNYPNPSKDDNITIPSRVGPFAVSAHCPNCGFKVPRSTTNEAQSAYNSPVDYGDRILVLKYLYLLQDPHRWDVVVFKAPLGDYNVNFIKRLVGRPGEALMILDGDVYVSDKTDGDHESWPWKVQSKPRSAQEALWRIVFDNDYQPVNSELRAEKWVNPWQQRTGKGWDTGPAQHSNRIFKFDNPSGSGTLAFNKDANPVIPALTDWLPYDETMPAYTREHLRYDLDAYVGEHVPHWNVSDIKLHFFYQRSAGTGALRASVSKLDHVFTAELTPGHVKLLHRLPSGQVRVAGEADAPATTAPEEVELSNADYQVILRINGKDLLRTTPQEYAPDMPDLWRRHKQRKSISESGRPDPEQIRAVFPAPTIQLAAENQTATISHLSLWRDVYYTPTGQNYSAPHHQGSPENPVVLHRRGAGPNGESYDNEYWVLGDNSILSGDARMWEDPVRLRENEDLDVPAGRVPERFLLGKAFFVYWPAGYRPFSLDMPGIVPNFGSMRFIH